MAFLNHEFRKATFMPSQDRKATFLNRGFMKVAFLNLRGRESGERRDPVS